MHLENDINKFINRFKKKSIRQTQITFCYCPNCNTELVGSNSFKGEDDGIVTYKCDNCNEITKWDFGTPCPILLEKE